MGAEPEGCYDAPPTASMKRNFSGQVCRPEGAPPAPRSRPPPLRRKAATPRAPGVSRGPPCGYHAGQRVDVLDTVKKWAEAEVVRVDDAARRLLVTYTYWSDKWDEWLPAESPRIAPFGSRTYQRGGNPTPGQRVEALDETGAWLEAEVLDARPGAAFVHYKGFHRKFDDWVDVGTRLREFGRTRAPQLRKRPPPPRRTYAVADGPETDDGAPRPADAGAPAPRAPRPPRAVPATGDVFDRYQRCLRRRGLSLVRVDGDGNCLFRSVAHQVYGDDVHHDVVRRKCMDYMDAEQAFFEPYVEGDASAFRRYVAAKRRDGAWGDEPEVQALCELYDRPAEIWSYDAAANAKAGGAKVLRTFHGGEQASAGGAMAVGDVRRAPMRLSYYGGGHYDSVVRDAEPPLLYCEPPGQLEDAAIRRALARKRAADPAAARGAEAASDVEATDAARVAAALELSRGEFEAHDDDLEATLRASLDAAQDPEAERGVLQAQLDDAAVARAEEEELARALALSQEPWAADAEPGGGDADLARALADSAGAAAPSGDADLAAAIDLSARDSGEDAILAAAIAASLEQR